MASETELERLVVRLMGDGSNYAAMLQAAQVQTKTAAKAFVAVSTKIKALGASMTQFGIGMLKFVGPVAAIGAASIVAFASFDKAMVESTSIMQVTAEQTENMRDLAIELGTQGVQGPKDLAKSYFFLASAGLDAEQSMAALPVVQQFATAGAFDMATATDLLTDAQSALGLTVKDSGENMQNMTRLSNLLVGANTLANASVQQFSTALTSKAGAAFKAYNIDIEEGVALLAAFADQGIKSELAGNAADRLLRLLTKSAAANADEFARMNIKVFDATGEFRSFQNIIGDLERALQGMSTEQKAAALEALGFEARVQAVILPLLGASESMGTYAQKLRDMGDISKEVADKQMLSLANRGTMLLNKLKVLGIEIGKSLVPAVEALVETLGPVVEGIKNWVAEHPTLVAAVISTTAALAALSVGTIVFGAVISSVGSLVGAMPAVFSVATQAIGLLSTALNSAAVAFLLNPVTLAIAALVGVIGTLILISRDAEEAIGELSEEQQKLQTETDKVTSTYKNSFDRLKELSAQTTVTTAEHAESQSIINELEKEYGKLGLELDEVTGKLKNVEEATLNVNKAMDRKTALQAKETLAELNDNIAKTTESIDRKLVKAGFTDDQGLPLGDSKNIKSRFDVPGTAISDLRKLEKLEKERDRLLKRVGGKKGLNAATAAPAIVTRGERERAEKAVEPSLEDLAGAGFREAKKLQEEADKERNKKREEEMKKEAERLTKQFKDPQQTFDETVDQLRQLRDAGEINEGTFLRGMEKAAKDLDGALDKDVEKLKQVQEEFAVVGGIQGTLAGTAEAVTKLAQHRAIGSFGAEDKQERMINVLQAILEQGADRAILEVQDADIDGVA